MSDILSVFEGLSKSVGLNQQDVLVKLQSVSAPIQEAFKDKDSRVLRNSCVTNHVFSDGIQSFVDAIQVFHHA